MQPYNPSHDIMIATTEYEYPLEIMFKDVTALYLIEHDYIYELHPVSYLIIDDLPF